jgi:hypothetical protein
VNSETVNLIERPYQEVIDDILTSIAGGVVNEPVIFDLKTDLYALAEPAREVRKITGIAKGELYHVFLHGIDFVFRSEPDNAVIWQEGGTWPDDDTTFYVDYYRRESASPLDDLNVGSVTRTLGEAIGREIATVYEQINRADLSAFVDTAEGKSLDLVVSILGVTRLTKDYAIGLVTFFRDPAVRGSITIPEGTLLTTTKGEVAFRTTQLRTLQQGQSRINVPIRADEEFKGEAGLKVEVGAITKLSQPIAGIDRVTNFESPTLDLNDESDEELRSRAKAALKAKSKGTLAALRDAIAENHASLVEIWEPNGPAAKKSDPGLMKLLVESKPGFFSGLQSAIEENRAAGVRAILVARYIYIKPRVQVHLKGTLSPAGKDKLIMEVIAALQKYFEGLGSGDPAKGEEMLKAIKSVGDVEKAVIMDVITWRADIGQPDTKTLIDAIMDSLLTVLDGDENVRRQAIADAISNMSPLSPTEERIPDRSLVMDLDGKQQANDEQIEEGKFQVITKYKGDDWWPVLEMDEKADILLKYKES